MPIVSLHSLLASYLGINLCQADTFSSVRLIEGVLLIEVCKNCAMFANEARAQRSTMGKKIW